MATSPRRSLSDGSAATTSSSSLGAAPVGGANAPDGWSGGVGTPSEAERRPSQGQADPSD
uniref:Uncharacterized protein n=1 Tax=Oryza meridionalis TaxID=40149 RepID=A0A0E0EZP7_9ORYZ